VEAPIRNRSGVIQPGPSVSYRRVRYWIDPAWFRFGASSLLNDLLLQRQKLATGAYSGADYVTID